MKVGVGLVMLLSRVVLLYIFILSIFFHFHLPFILISQLFFTPYLHRLHHLLHQSVNHFLIRVSALPLVCTVIGISVAMAGSFSC
ncbi:hypothetical protein QVD17_26482 [Tagetes erecta]|uniref:Uncharacterized protein n=1 Tax=Tagetes erecta TaxID=13708 RepID=A0AAD8KD01_TARER|nr:hypothetical protein QVD17_26482 [Tagetes erecta]